MIDDRLLLRTPEGAHLTLLPAGPLPRGLAFTLDFLIRIALYLGITLLLLAIGLFNTGLMLILVFLLEWFYPVIFEMLWNGQTPGKKALRLSVIHSDGTPLTLNGSIIRNLLRSADFFPLLYLTGLITMLLNTRFQRLGDLAADTLVIHLPDKPVELPTLPGQSIAPDWPVTLEDQQVLVSLLERQQQLGDPRVQELARFGWPEQHDKQAQQTAMAISRYLRGQP
ncbi:MAG: RDD family protein [Gammaproteobacteria bacterium HGW-Gammaproteobacteria-14]|nr:MAG: RDD family protein [Gammaproteobacteria bacterium HGW-Gammaproteobacteria-14]